MMNEQEFNEWMERQMSLPFPKSGEELVQEYIDNTQGQLPPPEPAHIHRAVMGSLHLFGLPGGFELELREGTQSQYVYFDNAHAISLAQAILHHLGLDGEEGE